MWGHWLSTPLWDIHLKKDPPKSDLLPDHIYLGHLVRMFVGEGFVGPYNGHVVRAHGLALLPHLPFYGSLLCGLCKLDKAPK